MQKLLIVLVASLVLGAAQAQSAFRMDSHPARPQVSVADNTYGHWLKCADATGMCGLASG